MSYTNIPPSMQDIYQSLNNRLDKLESAERFTAPYYLNSLSQPEQWYNVTMNSLGAGVSGVVGDVLDINNGSNESSYGYTIPVSHPHYESRYVTPPYTGSVSPAVYTITNVSSIGSYVWGNNNLALFEFTSSNNLIALERYMLFDVQGITSDPVDYFNCRWQIYDVQPPTTVISPGTTWLVYAKRTSTYLGTDLVSRSVTGSSITVVPQKYVNVGQALQTSQLINHPAISTNTTRIALSPNKVIYITIPTRESPVFDKQYDTRLIIEAMPDLTVNASYTCKVILETTASVIVKIFLAGSPYYASEPYWSPRTQSPGSPYYDAIPDSITEYDFTVVKTGKPISYPGSLRGTVNQYNVTVNWKRYLP